MSKHTVADQVARETKRGNVLMHARNKPQARNRWLSASAGAALLAGLVLAPLPAQAETQSSGALNCYSDQILSSQRDNGTANSHKHYNGGNNRVRTWNHAAAYTWTYYNSGYTSVSSVVFGSNNDISNWGRSCDY